MKTVFRVLVLGLFAAVIMTANTVLGLAQADCNDLKSNTALYQKFIDNYQSNDKAKIQIAINSA